MSGADLFGVPVDARIERGRTYRHALRQTIAHEHYQSWSLNGIVATITSVRARSTAARSRPR
jgi:hypothetical protein